MNAISPYPRCADAAHFFEVLMADLRARDFILSDLATLLSDVGVDILALVDHWTLSPSHDLAADLVAWGYVEDVLDEGAERAWMHPLARLPRVRFGLEMSLVLAVDDITVFFDQTGLRGERMRGDSDSAYETARVRGASFSIAARRGYRGFVPALLDARTQDALAAARQSFIGRPRTGREDDVVASAQDRWIRAADILGVGRAVDEFFWAEREYYLARNAAARWQGERQAEVGIGWANHDHHTYRSSREGFQSLMQLWQTMGFTFRERFYAGAEAGWGAQILEHPESRVVLFCDVDMAPQELDVDFVSTSLPPRDTLGTIGLWCALHGSSIAAAGMHHLECEFDFTRCEDNLKAAGFGVMRPFTDLPMLKQAFTTPERWKVSRDRLAHLMADRLLTAEQATAFAQDGAAGSHLEILQRWEGFKGFNKTGVSEIIRDTDARKAAGVA